MKTNIISHKALWPGMKAWGKYYGGINKPSHVLPIDLSRNLKAPVEETRKIPLEVKNF